MSKDKMRGHTCEGSFRILDKRGKTKLAAKFGEDCFKHTNDKGWWVNDNEQLGNYELDDWEEVKAYAAKNPNEFHTFLLLSPTESPEEEEDQYLFNPLEIVNCELEDQVPTFHALFICDQIRNAREVSCGECGEVLFTCDQGQNANKL